MRVVFTRAARTDLADIEDYIARDNPSRASTFIDEVLDACAAIADMPFSFPIMQRYADRGYRRKVLRDYLIVYSVGEDQIDIVRITQGARDIEQLLKRRDL